MKTVWTEAARRDLDFFAEQADAIDPDLADRLLDEADKATRLLAQTPGIGSPQGDDGIRKLRLGKLPYVMLYVMIEGCAHVTRLHHSRENWRK